MRSVFRRLSKELFARVLAAFVSTLTLSCAHISSDLRVGDFGEEGLDGWSTKKFSGNTEYSLSNTDTRRILKAVADKSASALYKRVDVDLHKTPYLNWTWRVENTLNIADETRKSGDDFAARVYVVIKPRPFRFKPRSLNYVWASSKKAQSSWLSPYTENVTLLALRSGEENLGEWVQEKRDVRADLQRFFGEDFQHIEGLAIMTDTDNSEQSAIAYYGDIFFSAD